MKIVINIDENMSCEDLAEMLEKLHTLLEGYKGIEVSVSRESEIHIV